MEQLTALEWLYDKLAAMPDVANNAKRIGPAPIPEGTATPYVAYKILAGEITAPINGEINHAQILVELAVVDDGQTPTAIIKTILEGADTAIRLQSGDTSSGSGAVLYCIRERVFSFPYRSKSGRVTQVSGAVYRLYTRDVE